MGQRNDGQIVVGIGVSRSGKSVWVNKILEGKKRVIVFDPKAEYGRGRGWLAVTDFVELFDAVRAKKAQKISFTSVKKGAFDYFCQCAWVFNLIEPAAIVCEELAANGASGAARGAWGRLINQGLAFGMLLIGTVQRGQEVDKSIMNNATFLHISRHNTLSDREYIAKKLGIDVGKIPAEPLRWVQWNSDRGVICSGKIEFMERSGDVVFSGKLEGDKGKKNKVFHVKQSPFFAGVEYFP